MTAHLLDVNVLVALIDPTHVHHDRAHAWFAETGRSDWLSCATTLNGAIRVVSHPRYSNAQPVPVVVDSLRSLVAVGSHRFVSEDTSLLRHDLVDPGAVLSSAQVTDVHLLVIAVRAHARLATFDRRMTTRAVLGATVDDIAPIA